jgi:hypothetical protein
MAVALCIAGLYPKVPVILHDNLKGESLKLYGPPTGHLTVAAT